ncbi:hypothetical protein A2U01_0090223, partial [Trifolium medium]|nr:hypothetical protein [Trifolium medium]
VAAQEVLTVTTTYYHIWCWVKGGAENDLIALLPPTVSTLREHVDWRVRYGRQAWWVEVVDGGFLCFEGREERGVIKLFS